MTGLVLEPTAPAASVAERVYGEIRQRILDGRYRLNERIAETDLAAELSSSRTPIRQALQRLELEGLVLASRSGWIVREHTVEEIQQIYDVRVPLEGYAARLAAERGSDDDHARIRSLAERAREVFGLDDRAGWVTLSHEFHDAVYQTAGNEVLLEAVRQFRRHPYNRRVIFVYTDSEVRSTLDSHDELAQAISARDADATERLARAHVTRSGELTLQALRRLG